MNISSIFGSSCCIKKTQCCFQLLLKIRLCLKKLHQKQWWFILWNGRFPSVMWYLLASWFNKLKHIYMYILCTAYINCSLYKHDIKNNHIYCNPGEEETSCLSIFSNHNHLHPLQVGRVISWAPESCSTLSATQITRKVLLAYSSPRMMDDNRIFVSMQSG